MQFCIGLVQSTAPLQNTRQWEKWLNTPPTQSELAEWFAQFSSAFDFDGDGPRFMQDLSLRVEKTNENSIAGLLIDAPGEQTRKQNTDHFVKRAHVEAMCADCAAAALLTLQTNCPSGGSGHRTGLRGGGPLSTLLIAQSTRNLWHDVWLNVSTGPRFIAGCGNHDRTALFESFPWMAELERSQPSKDNELAPDQVHPRHVFWAMPRRIRLELTSSRIGTCDLCARSGRSLVMRYATRPYGINYKGPWIHPLTPYYEDKDEWRPIHPRPGGLGYRHWLAWVYGSAEAKARRQSASNVLNARTNLGRTDGSAYRIWAFGYDMENMKARCWYESKIPLFHLLACDESAQKQVEAEVKLWLTGATQVATTLRGAVKDAWFTRDARGDLSHVDASFWSRTESVFYLELELLIEHLRAGEIVDVVDGRERWLTEIQRAAVQLFDAFAASGTVARQRPSRIAAAHMKMRKQLYGPKLRDTLMLPKAADVQPPPNSESTLQIVEETA